MNKSNFRRKEFTSYTSETIHLREGVFEWLFSLKTVYKMFPLTFSFTDLHCHMLNNCFHYPWTLPFKRKKNLVKFTRLKSLMITRHTRPLLDNKQGVTTAERVIAYLPEIVHETLVKEPLWVVTYPEVDLAEIELAKSLMYL